MQRVVAWAQLFMVFHAGRGCFHNVCLCRGWGDERSWQDSSSRSEEPVEAVVRWNLWGLVSVLPGCCDRIPYTEGLTNHRCLSHSLEAGSCVSGAGPLPGSWVAVLSSCPRRTNGH